MVNDRKGRSQKPGARKEGIKKFYSLFVIPAQAGIQGESQEPEEDTVMK
ncbi:MAG: hypothetical protein U9N03_07130 [Candidatus Caldatribacteriota bacterium]|nr:hypothetical protein [Candidatus Caldatribacteriota bacterium]